MALSKYRIHFFKKVFIFVSLQGHNKGAQSILQLL